MFQSSHGESPAPSLEEKVEEKKPEPPKVAEKKVIVKPEVKVVDDKKVKEEQQAAIAATLVDDIVEDVIKSDTTEPSIPAVVLDTVNEVIMNEVNEEEIVEEKPPTPNKIVDEIETQESSLDIGDEESEMDSQRNKQKRKEFTINGQAIPEQGAVVLNGHVTRDQAKTNHVTKEVKEVKPEPTRTRQEPKTLDLQTQKSTEKPKPQSPTKAALSPVEEKKARTPSQEKKAEGPKYNKKEEKESSSGTISRQVS